MFTEVAAVQNPLTKYAVDIGWTFVADTDALVMRRGESGMLFYDVLRAQLLALNPGVVTNENVDEVVRRIENMRASIEGNAEALSWLRGEQSVFDATEKRQRDVTVVDFERPNKNVFHVTVEWAYTPTGRKGNRADVMFLINGLPVALVETKNAKKPDAIDVGIVQVRRYHRETPELVAHAQVFDVTHLIQFYYGVTWNLDRKALFNWKDEEPGNFEKKVKRFFDRERFLKLLRDWILFYRRDDELRKAILRQHQTRAVERVVDRAADATKRRALVWHTQGSGKTFTMIKAAQQIMAHPAFEKPTVIMLVDRNELEGQLSGWVAGVLGERAAVIAESKRMLRELLLADHRGLIISMIHKFDKADADLCKRDNVIVLVDEAHRTTGGDLGNYLVGALPNATFIGFTGTPIDRTAYGQGTFKVFGPDDPPHGYLDRYSIAESIEDGTTLPLRYTLAPNDLRVPTEQLEREFLSLAEMEGVSDIEDLNRILDRAVTLKAFLKASDRVEKVTQFVADHFRKYVEPLGYKAFLVGVDREACALYKTALDKHLPPEYSRVVYTSAHNDNETLTAHRLGEDEEKQLRKAFMRSSIINVSIALPEEARQFVAARPSDFMYEPESRTLVVKGTFTEQDCEALESLSGAQNAAVIRKLFEDYRRGLPKILIVTEKLLTGFDAPILYCMYLDKPMRDHVLLQAIARVNRPYEEDGDIRKPSGLVVDFVGIFEKLEQALKFESDVLDITRVLESLQVLKDRFEKLMNEGATQYLSLATGKKDDKAVEQVIEAFAEKERRQEFYEFYHELETLYEILSPDPFLRPYLDDYLRLTELYEIARSTELSGRTVGLGDLMRKTEVLVREKVDATELRGTLPIYEINEQTLKVLKESRAPYTVKVVNLVKSIEADTSEAKAENPILRSIVERAEHIAEQYEDRQLTTEQTLKELEQLVAERLQAEEERTETGFDIQTFAAYWSLKQGGVTEAQAVALAPEIDRILKQHMNWKVNQAEAREFRLELTKMLIRGGLKDQAAELVSRLLESQRSSA